MLSTHAVKSSLPAAVRRRLSSPYAYPAIYHALRDVAQPAAVFQRHKSTNANDDSPIVDVAPAVTYRRPTSLFDIDDFFFPRSSFFDFSHPRLSRFSRRMNLIDGADTESFLSPGCDTSSGDDGHVKITLDLPGVKADDIDIEVKDGKLLKVSGNRKVERDGAMSTLEFVRRFTLNSLIDQDSMTANLADGVLTIKMPKMEAVENVKKIEITQNPDESHADGNKDEGKVEGDHVEVVEEKVA